MIALAAAGASSPARAALATSAERADDSGRSGLERVSVHEPRLILPAGLEARAGESLEIRWSAPASVSGELEILLSLDDGRSFPLRVSPELDARAGRYVWRVPNLAARAARLRIRYESSDGERASESSESFVIAGDASRPVERALVAEGEWWSGLDGPRRAPAALADRGAPSLRAARTSLACEAAPRAPLVPRREARIECRPSACLAMNATARPESHQARSLPLRN